MSAQLRQPMHVLQYYNMIIYYRFQSAGVDQPFVIYVDRGCCRHTDNLTQLATHFLPRTTPIRLDSFHYIQRFRYCCTTESHPLYAEFIGRISSSIFEWDEGDVALLVKAKRGATGDQLNSDHVVNILSSWRSL